MHPFEVSALIIPMINILRCNCIQMNTRFTNGSKLMSFKGVIPVPYFSTILRISQQHSYVIHTVFQWVWRHTSVTSLDFALLSHCHIRHGVMFMLHSKDNHSLFDFMMNKTMRLLTPTLHKEGGGSIMSFLSYDHMKVFIINMHGLT